MKYCSNCGKELQDTDSFCDACGCKIEVENNNINTSNETALTSINNTNNINSNGGSAAIKKESSGLQTVAFVFLILSTVSLGALLIPLLWCIPMCIKYYKHMTYGDEISVVFKVCTLIFVNFLSGILMLCEN